MRRAILEVVALLVVASAALAAERPNVLLIVSDDQGYGDLSLHRNPQLQTPNLDKLARQSAQFSHFYVSPVCAPTRASLLTGRYSLRTGTWGVQGGRESMRADEFTLAEVLRAAGWRTGLFGKWHNGEHWPQSPQGQGFDDFFGFTRGHWNNYFDTTLLRGETEEKTHGYLQDVLTDEAMKFIETNRDRPFFCDLSYNTPHSPFQVPDAYFDRYKKLGLSDELACIYGMCANMDDNVGRVLAKLDEIGLAESTIVIFMSDNGPNTFRFNDGMKGKKGQVDEGGVRVPCFIRWLGKITPHVAPHIAAHIDLMPTLLDLLKIAPPPAKLDGISLAPLLMGGTRDAEPQFERELFVHHVQGDVPKPFPGSVRNAQYRAVNTGKAWELYDMQADPGQKHDLAETEAELTRDLSKKYDAWWRDVAPEKFVWMPVPIGYEGHDRVEISAADAREMPGLKFNGRHPNNAWLTGWTSLDSHAAWQLDAVRDGTYRVTLQYLAETEGARVRVSVGKSSGEATLAATPFKQIPSPDRSPREEVYEMQWATTPLGEVQLEKGLNTLRIDALEKPGAEVMQLKAVIVERL